MSFFRILKAAATGNSGAVTTTEGGRCPPSGTPQPKIVRPAKSVKQITPDTTPLLKKRGWKKSLLNDEWSGHYVTSKGTFPGRIERRGDAFYPYIKNPPKQVTRHHKYQCFHKRAGGWWWVHLHTQPKNNDPSAVLTYMERLLTEALKN